MVALYIINGTLLNELKPSSILAAAEADVRRYRDNVSIDGNEPYAFHRVHVRRGMRHDHGAARDIIAAALVDIERGRQSGKRLTRELYRDVELLKKAIDE